VPSAGLARCLRGCDGLWETGGPWRSELYIVPGAGKLAVLCCAPGDQIIGRSTDIVCTGTEVSSAEPRHCCGTNTGREAASAPSRYCCCQKRIRCCQEYEYQIVGRFRKISGALAEVRTAETPPDESQSEPAWYFREYARICKGSVAAAKPALFGGLRGLLDKRGTTCELEPLPRPGPSKNYATSSVLASDVWVEVTALRETRRATAPLSDEFSSKFEKSKGYNSADILGLHCQPE
jgi:hypothetical protein